MNLVYKYFFSVGVIFLLSVSLGYAQKDTSVVKQKRHKHTFVDKDGDGYNDNAPDHDGDGIPNGLDSDYLKLKKERRRQGRYIDLDGDGINDYDIKKSKSKTLNESLINENQKGNSINKQPGKAKGKGGGKKSH